MNVKVQLEQTSGYKWILFRASSNKNQLACGVQTFSCWAPTDGALLTLSGRSAAAEAVQLGRVAVVVLVLGCEATPFEETVSSRKIE